MAEHRERLVGFLLLGAAVLFVAVAIVQAFTREGFSLERHALSQLSLGRLGWIQIANFVLGGILFLAFALGVRRALRTGPGRIWGSILVAVFGVSLVTGGVFVALVIGWSWISILAARIRAGRLDLPWPST